MKFWALSKKYVWNLLISLDQLGNTILGGDPDETISSRAGKNRDKKHWDLLSRLLNAIDKNHVEKAREDDEGKDAICPGRDRGSDLHR